MFAVKSNHFLRKLVFANPDIHYFQMSIGVTAVRRLNLEQADTFLT